MRWVKFCQTETHGRMTDWLPAQPAKGQSMRLEVDKQFLSCEILWGLVRPHQLHLQFSKSWISIFVKSTLIREIATFVERRKKSLD